MAMSKAQFFTLDALLALIAAVAMASMILLSFKSDVPTISDTRLHSVAQDTLELLDKEQSLYAAAQGNTNSTQNFLGKIPSTICGKITITDTLNTTLATITKQSCGNPTNPTVHYRTVVQEDTFYIAKMEAWWA